jgi:hypothetical protein
LRISNRRGATTMTRVLTIIATSITEYSRPFSKARGAMTTPITASTAVRPYRISSLLSGLSFTNCWYSRDGSPYCPLRVRRSPRRPPLYGTGTRGLSHCRTSASRQAPA